MLDWFKTQHFSLNAFLTNLGLTAAAMLAFLGTFKIEPDKWWALLALVVALIASFAVAQQTQAIMTKKEPGNTPPAPPTPPLTEP